MNFPRRRASFTRKGCNTAKYRSKETHTSTLLLRYSPKARRKRKALQAKFPASHCTVRRQETCGEEDFLICRSGADFGDKRVDAISDAVAAKKGGQIKGDLLHGKYFVSRGKRQIRSGEFWVGLRLAFIWVTLLGNVSNVRTKVGLSERGRGRFGWQIRFVTYEGA